ncbi:hypothetical protein JX265_007239 [Neoarthrinium moseri]|uniref:DUF1776-domain-containing protein n=1 Tax=Neoarthrinium moseri TaxID=1658444 RepID=A0A9P9WK29_9PEZI|nr:uncharacterized protein JN550_012131 [Neoarthrinium moseri]KAI1859322.1 hypothetical protein JN550_012131 [Neoarthrinium moseri]KAI1867437.1 hypothetical protein JX265_007239 [Neoarthrinium moseri]
MSADDQQFLDVLSSLPNQIRRYSTDVADYVDKTVDKAADSVRDSLASVAWLPDYIRPSPPRPPPVAIVPMTAYEKLQDWVSRHKILTGVMVLGVTYVTYKAVRTSKSMRKSRRAKRAKNGGRLEVVVIAGSPTLPLTKSLSLDMERKGFIVYVVCGSLEEEVMVQNLSRPDIRPLGIDITDPPSAGSSIERFATYLQTPHAAVPRTRANYLTLTSIILIPSLNYQTSPIATIPPSSFADLFNTHLLHPILTIQSFLPLLTSRITPPGETPTTPKVLVFTPSIISSINPPFHAPEATVCSALSAFTEVLTGELRPLAIPVTHIHLGTFDFAGFVPTRHSNLLPAAETTAWPESARHVYGKNYVAQSSSAISAGRIRGLRGSSLRELHNAVFDVIDGSDQSGVVRIGLGAGLYGFVGRWVPRGLVSWMMGIRNVEELSTWTEGSSTSSGSDGGSSENGEASEFIAIGRDADGGANVWKED